MNKKHNADVLIVGAGPARSMASALLNLLEELCVV